MCKEVVDGTFEAEVLNSEVPVIVDFYSPTCVPCKNVLSILQGIEADLKKEVKILKMNVFDSPKTSSQYSIMSVPTVIGFKKGRITNSLTGARKAEDYLALV